MDLDTISSPEELREFMTNAPDMFGFVACQESESPTDYQAASLHRVLTHLLTKLTQDFFDIDGIPKLVSELLMERPWGRVAMSEAVKHNSALLKTFYLASTSNLSTNDEVNKLASEFSKSKMYAYLKRLALIASYDSRLHIVPEDHAFQATL